MLNNRVLVIGLERFYLDLLSAIKSEFVFLALTDDDQFNKLNHMYEALIIHGELVRRNSNVLAHYKGKPIFAIGYGEEREGVTWVAPPPEPARLEEALLDLLGKLRAPPIRTGDLKVGTIVKSKTFPTWGLGVVKRELADGMMVVAFPDVVKVFKKDEHHFHKSTLRMICTLKEITNEDIG